MDQNGYECFFGGKYLIGLKICGREFCVCGFDPFFFLECSKLFPLLIGLKTCGREFCVCK